ncbi:MAG: hypothetical protein KJT03_10150, partial [Verrucomicrobiae bacterium]|nr:hypothetical protein [Verrucomicrobiae bacterium]
MPNILRLIGLLGLVPLVPVLGNDIDDLQKKVNALTARVELLEKHLGMAKVSDAKALNTAPELLNLSELALIGKGKFETFCMACHKHEYSDPMLAPPMATVMDHYKQVLGKNKNKFVDTIVAWVKEPSTEKTLMPGAIRNFNLMPPFVLPDPDLEAIATYLFEAEIPKPGNFEEHLRMERRQLNQGGQGFGQGRGFGGNGRNLSQNQGLHTNTLRESETDSPSGSGHVSIKQSELTEL